MARLVKRKRRRLSFVAKSFVVLAMAFVMWLFASVFVGTTNTKLTMEIQKLNNEADLLRIENQQLTVDIQNLQNKERIYTIAKDAGLDQNQDNVLTIVKGE